MGCQVGHGGNKVGCGQAGPVCVCGRGVGKGASGGLGRPNPHKGCGAGGVWAWGRVGSVGCGAGQLQGPVTPSTNNSMYLRAWVTGRLGGGGVG